MVNAAMTPTVITTLVFLLLTGVLVLVHLRRTQPASDGSGADAATTTCLRCSTVMPATSRHCPSCGVPTQVYEVVRVQEATPDADGDQGRLHAIVRRDVCIGCGTCVSACPEQGAIRLVDHLAVVDLARCVGHGNCAEACPVNGIAITTGEAVQRVEVPVVDACFQSSVPGVYIVGELGGRGLIKNAINEARVAVESIADDLAKLPDRDHDADILDVVIVGAGPAGLSAGLTALGCGLRYAILERGTIADTIRKYPRQKLLLAEPVGIPLYGRLWVTDASKETLLDVWETVIESSGLQVQTGCEVKDVQREHDVLTVLTAGGAVRTRRVVLAVGRRGMPRRLGVPGEERANVYYDIAEASEFEGSRVVVVGGGDSAIESAVGLSNRPGTTVWLVHRSSSFEKAKSRNRSHLEEAVERGRLRLLVESEVREIRDGEVVVDRAGETIVVACDHVIIRVGGEAPVAMLDRIGVRRARKDLPIATGDGNDA